MGNFEAIFTILGIIFIPLLIFTIILVIANYKLFTKAGEEGWKSLIPIYNTWIIVQLAFGRDKSWVFFGVMLSSIGALFGDTAIGNTLTLVGGVFAIYVSFKFMRRYTDTGLAVASLFFPFIIMPIVAFSDKYVYTSPGIETY